MNSAFAFLSGAPRVFAPVVTTTTEPPFVTTTEPPITTEPMVNDADVAGTLGVLTMDAAVVVSLSASLVGTLGSLTMDASVVYGDGPSAALDGSLGALTMAAVVNPSTTGGDLTFGGDDITFGGDAINFGA